MGFFCAIPYAIGLIYIIKFVFIILGFIIKHLIPMKSNLKEKYGDGYVIITGGSRGIGKSFAKEFLKDKFKVCLISSNKDKLESTRKELLDLYPNSIIKIIDYNFDQFYTEETIKKLEERISTELNGEEISILFNNAGVFHEGGFDSVPTKTITKLINVNICGLTILTKIIIEYMKKRTKKSLIIGSGSFDGQFRTGNRALYSSTKSYVEAFYEGLTKNFGDKFDFTLIEIGPVKTDMNQKNYPFICSSDDFASQCIKLVGKYKFIQGCRGHAILKGLMTLPFAKELSTLIDKKIAKK